MNKRGSEINPPKVPECINGKAPPPPDCESGTHSSWPQLPGNYSPKSRWGGVRTDVGNAYWEQHPCPKE